MNLSEAQSPNVVASEAKQSPHYQEIFGYFRHETLAPHAHLPRTQVPGSAGVASAEIHRLAMTSNS